MLTNIYWKFYLTLDVMKWLYVFSVWVWVVWTVMMNRLVVRRMKMMMMVAGVTSLRSSSAWSTAKARIISSISHLLLLPDPLKVGHATDLTIISGVSARAWPTWVTKRRATRVTAATTDGSDKWQRQARLRRHPRRQPRRQPRRHPRIHPRRLI